MVRGAAGERTPLLIAHNGREWDYTPLITLKLLIPGALCHTGCQGVYVVVGYVVIGTNFDFRWLAEHFRRVGVHLPPHWCVLDTFRLAQDLRARRLLPNSLNQVPRSTPSYSCPKIVPMQGLQHAIKRCSIQSAGAVRQSSRAVMNGMTGWGAGGLGGVLWGGWRGESAPGSG